MRAGPVVMLNVDGGGARPHRPSCQPWDPESRHGSTLRANQPPTGAPMSGHRSGHDHDAASAPTVRRYRLKPGGPGHVRANGRPVSPDQLGDRLEPLASRPAGSDRRRPPWPFPWPWRPPVMELVVVLPPAAAVLGVLVDG